MLEVGLELSFLGNPLLSHGLLLAPDAGCIGPISPDVARILAKLDLRDRTQAAIYVYQHCVVRSYAVFLPGLSSPLGSKTRLTCSCSSTARGDHCRASSPRFTQPIPCSPEIEPPTEIA